MELSELEFEPTETAPGPIDSLLHSCRRVAILAGIWWPRQAWKPVSQTHGLIYSFIGRAARLRTGSMDCSRGLPSAQRQRTDARTVAWIGQTPLGLQGITRSPRTDTRRLPWLVSMRAVKRLPSPSLPLKMRRTLVRQLCLGREGVALCAPVMLKRRFVDPARPTTLKGVDVQE